MRLFTRRPQSIYPVSARVHTASLNNRADRLAREVHLLDPARALKLAQVILRDLELQGFGYEDLMGPDNANRRVRGANRLLEGIYP